MAIPSAQMTRRRYGAGKLWAYTLGTPVLTSAYAPAGTGSAFTQGTSSTNVPGTASLLPLGITEEGMTFTSGFSTDNDESAEYYFSHKTIVTGQTASLKTTLKTVNLTNLRLALNAPTSAVSAVPTATVAAKVTPPLPGAEVRCQLLWESLDNNMLIVGYQALQTNELNLAGRKGAAGMVLDLEFTFEMPDAAIAPTPYDLWVIGTSWAETVNTE